MSSMVKIPAFRFGNFSSSYKQFKLGEITNSVSRPIKMEDEEDYNLVTVKRRNEGIVDRGIFKGREIKVKSQYKIEVGDFLISKRQIIHGACEIVPRNLDGAIVSNEYHILHGKKNLLLTEYLNLLSKLPKIKNYFALACVGVDIEKMLFRIEDWKKRSVTIPSIDEQQKITSFFKLLNQKIEKQQEKIEKLEELKKGMMQKIFSQERRFKDNNGGEFEEWEEKRLKDIADIVGGGTPSTSNENYWGGNIQWFTPTEISRTKFVSLSKRSITELGLNKSSARLLPPGTILLTSRATLGEMAIAPSPVTTNQGFQSIIPKEDTDSEFIYYLQPLIKKHCYEKASGSTFLEISKSNLEAFTTKIPSFEEQKKISNFLSVFDIKIDKERMSLETIIEMKKGFMQKMFV